MKPMFKKQCSRFGAFAGLLALLLLVSQPAEATSIVVNGGFETNSFAGWTLSGNTDFSGIITSPVHSGTYAAFFGAVGSDTILSQVLATTPGASYDLSFWLENFGGIPNDFSAIWDGLSASVSLINAPGMPFTQYVVTGLVATGTSTTLTFHFRQDPAYWHFDDVSVDSAVPEPSTWLLLATGLAAMAARRRFTKRP